MISKIILQLLLFTTIALNVSAQKFDYIWLSGYDDYAGYDTSDGSFFATTRFGFDTLPMQISRDSLGINFYRSNSIISDSAGNLLFYTNGVCIHNYLDQLVENGDSLAWGYVISTLAPEIYLKGEPDEQFHIVLPNPEIKGSYDIFYCFTDTLAGGIDLASTKLMRATLDMNANGGLGLVTRKDSVIFMDITDGAITAVKHANGRDWWIVTWRSNTNCMDVFLYNGSDTISSTVQCGGDSTVQGGITSTRFSPDGSKLVVASTNGAINIFNFDRCSGTISLKEAFIDTQIRDSAYWWPTSIEISPSSQFAYIFCGFRIFQFDLEADNIQGSKTVIAAYAGFEGPVPQLYNLAQLGPDGKIYVGSLSGCYYVGVIDNPDGQGASCNFLDHSIRLPTYILGLPTYCNWRLGALSSSGCDSLSSVSYVAADNEKELRVFPNPATDITTIDYGFTNWSKGAISMEITDEWGRPVYTKLLPMYSGFQKIDISRFATGVYQVFIKRNNGVVATNKLVVVH